MDRRQQKTRAAIFAAFSDLLIKKKYNRITVQDIIDRANVGRSTFYLHFETKDGLLDAMCKQIFEHVFSDSIGEEQTHDFSNKGDTIRHQLTHVLYHIDDNKRDFKAILSCDSDAILIDYFGKYLRAVFADVLHVSERTIPVDYLLNHRVNSFIDTVKWWLDNKKDYTPEQIIDFYLAVIGLNL